MQGVYNKLNTSMLAAESGESDVVTFPSNNMFIVETTLSFAIKPLKSDVQILQSPSPIGVRNGTKKLAIKPNILSAESSTRLSFKSKLCKNHTAIVAIKIIVNAFCRKSFAFSQSNCITFLALGSL